MRPQRLSITESVYASGMVKSANQYQVYATVSGLLTHAWVKEGDTVRSGSPLFRIQNDAQEISTQNAALQAEYNTLKANYNKIAELKANIEAAQSKYLIDSQLYAKQQQLWSANVGTQVELEQKEFLFRSSKSALIAAIYRLKDAQRQLELIEQQTRKNYEISKVQEKDFTVTSKINGRVYNVLRDVGEIINPSIPLAVIGSDKDFIIELQVDEHDIAGIKPGQKAFVTLDSYRGQVFEAVVQRIYPIMNERTRTFQVDAAFSNPPPTLYPNLTVEANILIQTKPNALTIPRSYLIGDTAVLLADNKLQKVTIGLKDFQKAEILAGLSETDEILRP